MAGQIGTTAADVSHDYHDWRQGNESEDSTGDEYSVDSTGDEDSEDSTGDEDLTDKHLKDAEDTKDTGEKDNQK